MASPKLTSPSLPRRVPLPSPPWQVMLQIALTALEPLHSAHWILDGFPRTLNQGILLDQVLAKEGRPLNLIVNLGVQDETILRRISGEDRALLSSLSRFLTRVFFPLVLRQTAGSTSPPAAFTTRPTINRSSKVAMTSPENRCPSGRTTRPCVPWSLLTPVRSAFLTLPPPHSFLLCPLPALISPGLASPRLHRKFSKNASSSTTPRPSPCCTSTATSTRN